MYFFYFDESGSRDPSIGTAERPKDHLYVLSAIGIYEGQWRGFDHAVSRIKLELSDYLQRSGRGRYDLADCEIKSNWLRNPKEREQRSRFLSQLDERDRTRLVETFYGQLAERKALIMSAVIDKRYLQDHMTAERLHKKAYEFLLERIENYMREYHDRHRALIVMDDTSRELNRAVAMKHAFFQRKGNQNIEFRHIAEYPFFTRSELSNGVQLADLIAYNVYRAFKNEDFDYPYFNRLWPYFYRRQNGEVLDGLKVWPEASPLVIQAKEAWTESQMKLEAGRE